MRDKLLALIGLFLLVIAAPARAAGTDDRWLELDLYWFSAEQPSRSAAQFWDRYQPLFADVKGYKGVVLNLGMTVDHVMEYRGDPQQRIPLPKGTGQELGVKLDGPLPGDTAQRQRAWRDRFGGHANAASQVGYGPWTYGGLKELAAALRREGARRGIPGFRVATFATGMDGAYGEPAQFALSHPEAWTKWSELAPGALASSSHFDPNAKLRADPVPRAGFPSGWPADTLLSRAFAGQWGALSREVGLDGIMLRDSFGYPRAYTRYGPWGPLIPDLATAERTTEGVARLIRESKQANPNALIMMWSTAATATSDWRANGIDLETIANEGFLDIYVDQTWAGAWGEVGVRQQTYWNAPILGWTYQHAYMMQHAAVLAKSKVRHYYLTEAFDAWESWDTIHTVPDRLRWGIWAFSHIGVKTPQGLRMPAGSYVSWGNHGHDLLSESDVAFLARELTDAARDAAATEEIHGPTLVYSRDAVAAQMDSLRPGLDWRDRTDEQVGSIAKWGAPVLSVTRAEWVPQVKSDLFLFGATTGMGAATRDAIVARARKGQPMAFFGAFGTATDPSFLALGGASVGEYRPPLQDRTMRAIPGPRFPAMKWRGKGFDAPPPQRANRAATEDIVYSFADSVGLARRRSEGLDVVLWDPPSLVDYWYRPIRENMNGDPTPYVAGAATIADQLAVRGAPRLTGIDPEQTMTVGAWTVRGGGMRVLAGNLEEGLRDDAQHSRRAAMVVPTRWRGLTWMGTDGLARRDTDGTLALELGPQGSVLLSARQGR